MISEDLRPSSRIISKRDTTGRGSKSESVFPNDKEIQKAYIRALIALGEENEAISLLNNLYSHADLKNDPSILEDVAWGILKKGVNSSQFY